MRRLALAAALAAGLLGAGAAALDRWVAATDLPPLAPEVSPVALAADGRLLRAWQVEDGLWRLPVTPDEVDPAYLRLLVAMEDRRFASHPGVDPLALLRAAGQAVASGRIVSGGSTLTMQVARLLERSGTGAWRGKLRQIRLALALERRLSKPEILALHLHLAPMGGNLEGLRAGALHWFGKEPRRLTPGEAALLVTLPQSPEARRPDRHPEAARAARDRILSRAVAAGVLTAEAAEAARAEPIPKALRPLPRLAPHLTDRLRAERPAPVIPTTLDRDLQAGLERLLADRTPLLGPGLSAAVLVAEHATGRVRAAVAAADPLDAARAGFVDMTRAPRSPGSLLKPLIYGLAFESGLAHPDTLLDDRPSRFGDYAPENFDRRFRGAIRAREALQLSLNVPAVALLDAVGPATLAARLRRAGAEPRLPEGGAPGLAMGLGGVGLTLEEIAALYAALAREGAPVALSARPGARPGAAPPPLGAPVLERTAAAQVRGILSALAPPPGSPSLGIAWKTGTSYGHRDAWAVGWDGRHVVAVWIGRPDGAAAPGGLGAELAAPLLHEIFGRLGPVALPPPPDAPAPAPLRRLAAAEGPELAHPPDGARVALSARSPRLAAKLRGGAPPFTWLVDGAPLPADPFAREVSWTPAGAGYTTVTVIDATGAAARARVFAE